MSSSNTDAVPHEAAVPTPEPGLAAPSALPTNGLVRLFRRWWWLLLASTLVAGVVGTAMANSITPTYKVRVEVLVGPYESDIDTLRASSGLAQTYARLVTSDQVTDAVASAIGVTDLADVTTNIKATANSETRVVSMWVESVDPNMAAAVANNLAAQMQTFSAPTEIGTGSVQLLQAATVPLEPAEPQVLLISALVTMTGLALGLIAALMLDRVDKRLRDDSDITAVSNLPVVGHMLGARRRPDGRGKSGAPLRAVASRILQSGTTDGRNLALALVPVSRGVHAGETAQELAATYASSGRSVLLITSQPGALTRDPEYSLDLEDLMSPTGGGWTVRPCVGGDVTIVGVTVPERMSMPPEDLAVGLASISGAASVVLFDLGPIEDSVWTYEIALAAGAVVFIVRSRRTTRPRLAEAVAALDHRHGRLVGVLVSHSRVRRSSRHARREHDETERKQRELAAALGARRRHSEPRRQK